MPVRSTMVLVLLLHSEFETINEHVEYSFLVHLIFNAMTCKREIKIEMNRISKFTTESPIYGEKK